MTPKEEMKIEFRMLGIEGNVRSWHLRESITLTDSMHTNFTDVYGADVLVVMRFLRYTLLYYERSVGDHLWRYGLVETDGIQSNRGMGRWLGFSSPTWSSVGGIFEISSSGYALSPRHVFHGVRIGADCLYQRTDETKGEKVHYVDVTSEYRLENKYRTYSVGN